jgi:hypothetical protein
MHASLVDWLGLLLSAITVILVGLYLRETNRIRIATEAQLEAQIAPAIVVRVQPDGELQFVNLGSGPALAAYLSGGHWSSPVSTTPTGECNAITNRWCGKSDLTLCAMSVGQRVRFPKLHSGGRTRL